MVYSKKKFLFLLAACFSFQVAVAQEQEPAPQNLEGDRPGKGDAATVVPQGAFQAEIGVELETEKDQIYKDQEFHLPEVLLRYGLLKFAEFRVHAQVNHTRFNFVQYPYPDDLTATKLAEMAVGTKLQLLKNKGLKPDLALQADFKLPLEANTTYKGRIEPKLGLNFRNKLSRKLDLQYTAAVEWEEQYSTFDPEKYTHLGHYAVSLNYKIRPDLQVFTEFYGETELEESSHDYSFDFGLAYFLFPNLQLDASTGFGLTESAPNSFVTAGVSFRLPK